MNFEYPIAFDAVKFMAVVSRLAAFLAAFPLFRSSVIPGKYRVFFVLMLAVVLMPVVPSSWIDREMFRNLSLMKLCFMMVSEVMLGLTLSLFVMCLSEVFNFGGYLIDRDMGFAMASTIDPATNTRGNIFSNVLGQVFFVAFLVYDGHHEVIRLAAYSFRTIPPGGFILHSNLPDIIISLSSQIFIVGLQIGFPVFAAMFIVNVAMGLLARIGQDFPVLMLSFPLRFGIGFIILMGLFPIIMTICRKVNHEMLEWIAYIVQF